MNVRALLTIASLALAGCASPAVTRFQLDPSLLPADLRSRLQDDYPRYRVASSSIEVLRFRAPAYHVELRSPSGKARAHRENLRGTHRPRVTFADRDRDGVIDSETYRYPFARKGWRVIDDDFDGSYDRRRQFGYFSYDVPVHIPVSSRIDPAAPEPAVNPE